MERNFYPAILRKPKNNFCTPAQVFFVPARAIIKFRSAKMERNFYPAILRKPKNGAEFLLLQFCEKQMAGFL